MPDRKDINIPTPEIVVTATQQIKETGRFRQGLGDQEIASLLKGFFRGVLQENPAVQANVPLMDIVIGDGKGTAQTTIRMEKPIGATIDANIVLANNPNGTNSLVLKNLKVNTKADGFLGRAALGAVNVEGQVRKALSSPTDALNRYLGQELRKNGVTLTGIATKFTADDKLTILLQGEPG